MHSSDVAGREIGIGRDCSRLLVVTKDVHEMMNTEKRNIVFGWYATNNVYKVQCSGSKQCLETASVS
jgi:hypothetical protein